MRSGVHIIHETFPNFEVLLSTLNKRPNNKIMAYKHDSNEDDYDFTKTRNYQEAVDLLRGGYKDILPCIKNSLEEKEKILSKLYSAPKPIPETAVVGFIPHVPNSIMNLPNSMINVQSKIRKQRTVSIMYFISSNCNRDTQFFINAGVALVSAINILETYGVQTKLTIEYAGTKDSYYDEDVREIVLSDVCIKNYGQRFNLQKICFPLAHPSMSRRIGFKYLETVPGLTRSRFADGYGTAFLSKRSIENFISIPSDTHIFTSEWINEHDNSVSEILKELGLI